LKARYGPGIPFRASDGALYSPTVVDRVTPDMPLVKYETFGPVSPIMRFRDIDEAIRMSNSTDYALSARTDAVRRREGFGARLQGRRAGGDEALHEYEDVFVAVVSAA
jgi:acyl-CoA reductase-like NAD-dependent aldehyde dehydrogenase